MFLILFLILLANLKDGYAAETGLCDEFWKEYGSDQVSVNISDCMVVSLKVDYPKNLYEAPEFWKFNISTEKDELYFQLHKVDSAIFTKNTKIFFANKHKTDNDSEIEYREKYIYEVAPNLKNVVVYHDRDHYLPAALVLHNSKNKLIVEGFIGLYTLRYFHSHQKHLLFRIFIDPPPITEETNNTNNADYFDLKSTLNPDIAYISFLVALDTTYVKNIRNYDHSEMLKNMLLYYNAVDLIYANFTTPKIKINIKGIIIPESEYLPKNSDSSRVMFDHFDKLSVLDTKSLYFLRDERFPASSYNIFLIMTGLPLSQEGDPHKYHSHYTTRRIRINEKIYFNQGYIRNANIFGDQYVAATIIYDIATKVYGRYRMPCDLVYNLKNRYQIDTVTNAHFNSNKFRWNKCDVMMLRSHFNYIQYPDSVDTCKKLFWESSDMIQAQYVYHKHIQVVDCDTVTSPLNLSQSVDDAPMNWKLNLETDFSKIYLNLQKVDSVIFNENTTIYFAYSKYHQYDAVYSQENIYSVAPKLKNVIVYHDPNNEHQAALIIYQSEYGYVLEGFIGQWALRYIPKQKKYILFKISIDSTDILIPKAPDTIAVNFNLNRPENIIHVPLLVAFDSTFMFDSLPSEVLKNLLLYYNAVDLIYSNFKSPKIKIGIEGVIIPKNKYSVPYLEKDYDDHSLLDTEFLDEIYFSESETFSSYNNVIVMSGLPFAVNGTISKDYSWMDYKLNITANSTNSSAFNGKVIRHPDFFGDYFIAGQVIFDILRTIIDEEHFTCNLYFVVNRYFGSSKFRWNQLCDNTLSLNSNISAKLAFGLGIPVLIILLGILIFVTLRYVSEEKLPDWMKNIKNKYRCFKPTGKYNKDYDYVYRTHHKPEMTQCE